MDDEAGVRQPLPSGRDEDLLREVLDLADQQAARITPEEVEARLEMLHDRVRLAGGQTEDGRDVAHVVGSDSLIPTPTVGDRSPALIAAHRQAIVIVEAARREAEARRSEARGVERYLAAARREASKLINDARANADITNNHALSIIETARERADWIVANAQKEREIQHEAELVSAGSSSPRAEDPVPRHGSGSGRYCELGPMTAGPRGIPSASRRAAMASAPTFARNGRRRRWMRRYLAALVLADAAAATVAAVIAYFVRFSEVATGYAAFSALFPVIWVGAAALCRAYEDQEVGLGSEEFQRVVRAFVAVTAVIGFAAYTMRAEMARGYVVLAVPIALALSLLARQIARGLIHRMRLQGRCLNDVLVVGNERHVADLTYQLHADRASGMRVVGACLVSGDGAQVVGLGIPLLGGLDDVITAVRDSGADTVAVTSSAELDPARLRRLAWELEGTATDLVVAPGLMEVAGPRLHIRRPVTGLPLLHVEEPEFAGGRRVIKGLVDRAVAGVALLLFAPLFLAITLGVRLSSPGKAIFRQTRIGKNGREFTMLKFRSMYVDAEARRAELLARNERAEGLLFKIKNDPRVTPLGKLLRKLSLDELPQLVNVLTGSMSLVGPRPPLPAEVALYEDDVRRRLLVKPGLTGLWQISGRSDLTWEESVRIDLRYVDNWSLTLDFMILWKTMFVVAKNRGAY